MTTQDKTGDKLVASIRKTKAGAGASSGTTKAAPARRRTTPKANKESPASADAAVASGYQSAGRVWPD